MKLLMASHQASIAQAQADRQASANRMARLEEAWIGLSVKPDPSPSNPGLEGGRIDLQRFRISDGPVFVGPAQSVEPFVLWIHGVQVFYATKGVTHDVDKIRLIGGLIRETNLLSFYANEVETLVAGSWASFKTRLFEYALPPLWRVSLRQQIRRLAMNDSESFLTYSTRARTMQSLLNFDNAGAVSDYDIAEAITLGTSGALLARIQDFQLLLASPFVYSVFESRANGFFEGLPKSIPRNRSGGQPAPQKPAQNPRTREETIWRVRSFLDSQGRCHFCKKACGSVPGACPGPFDKSFVEIPPTFKAPPKPADYKPPMPSGRSSGSAGRPTTAPAGRPAPRAATVAAIGGEEFPDMDEASIAALAALDKELQRQEEWVPKLTHSCIVIKLKHNDTHLRALIDTGSELNLITPRAAAKAKLSLSPLPRPTKVNLALSNGSASPLLLTQGTTTCLRDPHSDLIFQDVRLKIGPISGGHDLILGTPFLSHFKLSISIADHSVRCDRSGQTLFDHRLRSAVPCNQVPRVSAICDSGASAPYPCEKSEKAILEEYADIFPADIPDVTDDSARFPEKPQSEDSMVRHKIVLTDPNATFNERQYAYPQKHMASWRALLEQHTKAGRIRRSTSQWASPSMIIPKKDPTALPRWVCDYRKLNSLTVKDRSPLPKVNELLRLVASGKVFSILDQTNAFFQTRMREADIPLTAVKTPWGLVEWVVMPMGLTNAPATHQARLEEALGELFNSVCVVYLDDIVIYSNSFVQHEKHVRAVLDRLRRAGLYCSPKKTKLFRREVKFLGHWISAEGVKPDDEKIAQIQSWPSPTSPRGVKKFLGTIQWMKKFVWGLQRYVGTLTPLTSSKLATKDFKWGEAKERAFQNIKRIMTSLPCLKNIDYDSPDPLWLFTDASGSGLGAALFQGKEWKGASPIAYESHLMSAAERNYPVHEQELLAVIHALQKWRMLLLGMKVNVMTDHHSLTYLMKQKNLSRRQARWLELLADFDVNFNYIPGASNSVADALSRKDVPDEPLDFGPAEVACVAAMSELRSVLSLSLRDTIIAGYEEDVFCKQLRQVMPLWENCIEDDGLLFIDGRLVIPDAGNVREKLIAETHERLGHLGYTKTVTELRREFFWPLMAKDVLRATKVCDVCQKTKSPTTAPTGKMLSNPVPRIPLADLAIDFVGPLKPSQHYNMLLTCTCRLSGFTRLIPVLKSDTAERTASRFFAGWVAIFGAPRSIISDRDKLWTSHFWKQLMKRMGTDFHMMSSFHPQADGRSERTNKTVGQILRTFTSKRQGKWLESLPAVEFGINSALNVACGTSPFELIVGRRPLLFPSVADPGDSPKTLSAWLRAREDSWAAARDQLWVSRIKQALHHNRRRKDRPPLTEGSWALLNSADWRGRHQGGTDKLKERFEGPYRVLRVFNSGQSITLQLPEGDQRHATFHVSKVKAFHVDGADDGIREQK